MHICQSTNNGHTRPFEPALSMDDKAYHIDSVHRWMQRIMNIRMLDKIKEIITIFPVVTYAVYHRVAKLLGVNNLSNHVLRLIISTQYQKSPKIVIDTMEFEFTVRRIAGRGYSKLFQKMSMEELISLALDVDRLKTIMLSLIHI